jgi:GntR family transcriptional regulator
MTILIDPHSGVPVYRQIVDQLRFRIASGLLRPGDELPSTRCLSQELGLNPMTVSKSYGLLEQEGVVVRRAGLPLVVATRGVDVVEDEKMEQLRALLISPARAARALGFTAEAASAVLRTLVTEMDEESES